MKRDLTRVLLWASVAVVVTCPTAMGQCSFGPTQAVLFKDSVSMVIA